MVARTLARPVAATAATADRIAEGDLAARVPEPGTGSTDDELARLARSINAMAASLQQARHAEREFLLSVSHDLRTPLTAIGGWAEALADGAAPDPAAAGETIRAASARLDRLVRDLLDLARLRARAFTFDLATVDLREVATGTLDGFRPELEDSGLAVAIDVPAGPVLVEGDADRLAQVVANLVDNAGRHADTRLRVEVRAGQRPGAPGGRGRRPGHPGRRAPAGLRTPPRRHARPRRAPGPGRGSASPSSASWPGPWAATPSPKRRRPAGPGSWSRSLCGRDTVEEVVDEIGTSGTAQLLDLRRCRQSAAGIGSTGG